MRGIAFHFFLVAALCATLGMVWGIQMSASHDHTLSPAHGHLNLLGWVSMGMFGVYYAVTPHAADTTSARVHFWMALGGVALIAPGIALAIAEITEALAVAGSVLSIAAFLVFLSVVFRNGIGARV